MYVTFSPVKVIKLQNITLLQHIILLQNNKMYADAT